MRVLIADDDRCSRELLRCYLSLVGATCELATNGREAAENYELAFREGRRIDLICLDLDMPEVDGVVALFRIRQLETVYGVRKQNQVKILVISGRSDGIDLLEVFRSEYDGYFAKPLSYGDFTTKLRQLGLTSDCGLH